MKELELQTENTIYKIIIGNNKNENDTIIKNASPLDTWFHLENISGPHIILKNNGEKIHKRYYKYICSLFKQYKNGLPSNYNVIYTEIKNVCLTEIPGTVITKNTKLLKCNFF